MVNFPAGIDSLTNPTGTDDVSVVDHAAQHANANDILEALEAKVGADGSAVTTSHDYKLAHRQYFTFKTIGTANADYITDGIADEVQINQAMSDVNGAGGGIIYFMPGTYTVADIIQIPSNVTLLGAGIGVTTIKAVNSYNPATTAPFGAGSRTMVMAAANPVSNIIITCMTFDLNGQNASGGLSMTNAPHRLLDMRHATNFRFEGNEVKNGINWSVFISNSHDFWIENNFVTGGWSNTYTQNDGVHVRSSDNGFIRNNFIDTANQGGTSGDDCIAIGSSITESDQDCKNIVVSGNVLASGSRGILIFTEGTYNTKHITIDGNQISKAVHTGILLQKIGNTAGDGKLIDITIDGNDVTNFGTAGSTPGDGIGIESTVSPALSFYRNVTINGNTIDGGNIAGAASGVGAQGKGIGLVISNNNMYGLIGTRGIQVGTASAPNTDAIISNNRIDLSAGVTANSIGIFTYGLSRSVISGNQIYGQLAGTAVAIYIAAAATAGNDADGVARLEASAYNLIFGNQIYNFDNGITEVNAGANPDFSNVFGNVMQGVTTLYALVGGNSKIMTGDSNFWGFGVNSPTRQIHIKGTGQDVSAITDAGNKGATVYIQADANNAGSGGALVLGAVNGLFAAIKALLSDGSNNTRGHIAFSTRVVNSDTALTEQMRISDAGDIVLGAQAALATNATHGFSYMPSGAGTPSGVPTSYTGKVAFYYDSSNNIIYIYNGAWKKTAALT